MEVSPSLNATGSPIQRSYTTVNSFHVEAEKANPGSQIQKLKKAAQEFEGVLLSSWLEEMQKSSLAPSGTGQEAGAETLRSLGSQAVGLALAQRGGLGIAQMIVHHFRGVVGG
jgi:Rod binding domain-containing protein